MLSSARNSLRHARVTRRVTPCTGRWVHVGVELMEDLETRGYTENMTRPEALRKHVQENPVAYAGIDPTSRALHVGHLIPLMCLLHFHLRGHKVIPLIGGATARIGDPSGRSAERPQLNATSVERNADKISLAVTRFFQGATEYAQKRLRPSKKLLRTPEVMNNYDWYSQLNILDFLRTAGFHSRVNTMMGRESVKTRLDSEQGISFTEFTYQLLQAYDFYELHKRMNCTIQIGGSDQWGNILGGIDLINKLADTGQGSRNSTFGITTPLLTTSGGLKFSKSTGGAVWLDKSMSSYLDFYQFFLRATDAQVESWLKLFTLIPVDQIKKLMDRHLVAPHLRVAQKTLADEVTELVHGHGAVKQARSATKVLFDSDYSSVDVPEVLSALESDPKMVYVTRSELQSTPVIKLCVAFEFLTSISYAKNLVAAKGLKVNNTIIQDPAYTLKPEDLLGNKIAIVKAGPHRHLVLALKAEK